MGDHLYKYFKPNIISKYRTLDQTYWMTKQLKPPVTTVNDPNTYYWEYTKTSQRLLATPKPTKKLSRLTKPLKPISTCKFKYLLPIIQISYFPRVRANPPPVRPCIGERRPPSSASYVRPKPNPITSSPTSNPLSISPRASHQYPNSPAQTPNAPKPKDESQKHHHNRLPQHRPRHADAAPPRARRNPHRKVVQHRSRWQGREPGCGRCTTLRRRRGGQDGGVCGGRRLWAGFEAGAGGQWGGCGGCGCG